MENENPIYINYDHVDQWRQLHQVDGVSCQQHIVLLTSEQEQAQMRLMQRKENGKIWKYMKYMCAWHWSEMYINKMDNNGEIQGQ